MIDKKYFTIIIEDEYELVVQSKNTGHYWYIKKNDYGYVIFHKHKGSHPYHLHGRGNSLRQVIDQITRHDIWQMNGRKKI